MLILTRKPDQEIIIDGHIRVRVLASEGGRVRLGIVAPRHVPVVRSELTRTHSNAVPEAKALECAAAAL